MLKKDEKKANKKSASKLIKPKRKTKLPLLTRIENKINKIISHKSVSKKEIEKHANKIKASDVIGSSKKLTSLSRLGKKTKEVHQIIKAKKTGKPTKKEMQKIKEIAAEVKKHRIVTDFDRVIFYVSKKKRISVNKIVRDISIDKKRVEECAKILEEAGLIEIQYPIIGSLILQLKGYKQKKKKNKVLVKK